MVSMLSKICCFLALLGLAAAIPRGGGSCFRCGRHEDCDPALPSECVKYGECTAVGFAKVRFLTSPALKCQDWEHILVTDPAVRGFHRFISADSGMKTLVLQCNHTYTLFVKDPTAGRCRLHHFFERLPDDVRRDDDCDWCRQKLVTSCPANFNQTCGAPVNANATCDAPDFYEKECLCPDRFLSANTTCRRAAGCCDKPEKCTGLGPFCPPDRFRAGLKCAQLFGDASCPNCTKTIKCTNSSAFCPFPDPTFNPCA